MNGGCSCRTSTSRCASRCECRGSRGAPAGALKVRARGGSLPRLACFRPRARRRLALPFHLIVVNGGAHEILESPLVDRIALEEIDRAPLVAVEARVEEPLRIPQARPFVESELHLALVRVADREDALARPHRTSHPLPFLDDLPVGLEDALADALEHPATPVREPRDQLVNLFRWIHGSSCLLPSRFIWPYPRSSSARSAGAPRRASP